MLWQVLQVQCVGRGARRLLVGVACRWLLGVTKVSTSVYLSLWNRTCTGTQRKQHA